MNIKDIAREAGVSIATVSRVINNTAKVSDDARIRVEKVIKEANYRPNSLARELQQKRTNTIGVLINAADLEYSSLSELINSITDVLKAWGYNMMLANSHFLPEEEFDFFHSFQEKRVDGILYFATHFTKKHYEFLDNYPIPIVIIGQNYASLEIPCVVNDDYLAALTATEFLIARNHRHIGFIGCPLYDEASGIERKKGFEAALRMHQIEKDPLSCYIGDFTLQSGYTAMEYILKNAKTRPTAIFAATDYMAIGAIRYMTEHNIRVPEDISVMGFDNIKVSGYVQPTLTTIHMDKNSMGKIGTELLFKVMNKEILETKRYTVSFELIERESVRKILNEI